MSNRNITSPIWRSHGLLRIAILSKAVAKLSGNQPQTLQHEVDVSNKNAQMPTWIIEYFSASNKNSRPFSCAMRALRTSKRALSCALWNKLEQARTNARDDFKPVPDACFATSELEKSQEILGLAGFVIGRSSVQFRPSAPRENPVTSGVFAFLESS